VYARGFGVADRDTGRLVQPTTPFRMASHAKPFTSAAIMKLVENGQLRLDDSVTQILGLTGLADARWRSITVRNLLEHTGGWNIDLFDPEFSSLLIAQAMKTSSPPSTMTTINFMAQQRGLDFNPGEVVYYSNFGYSLLGRVIEKVTGVPYETYIKTLFAPAGIQNMYLGVTHSVDLPPDESRYYDYPGARLRDSVFSDAPGLVPYPDGGFAEEILDADGGWVLSAIDDLRILRYIDPSTPGNHLLARATVAEMLSRPLISGPAAPYWGTAPTWNAKGWVYNAGTDDINGEWSHSGSLPGSDSYIVRSGNGISYAVVFNTRDQARLLSSSIYQVIGDAVGSIKVWPSGDLFPQYTQTANYEGLWWNSPAGSESGWGINIAHQGDVLFVTWFTYDVNGKAWWLTMTANKTSDGLYSGTLYQTTGPAFNAVPFNAAQVVGTPVGNGTLTFTTTSSGTFAYTVNGMSQTKAIVPQTFGPLPTCVWRTQADLTLATNYQDLWWATPAGSESGWGVNLTHQGNTIFATWFTYDHDHTPMWLVATAPQTATGTYMGTLYRLTGPPFSSAPFPPMGSPGGATGTSVGTATFTFSDGNTGTFAYTVNAETQTKNITRELFHPPAGTVCQ
jgi:CubicO group peptidase (beta-lactamase class C family)